MRKSILLLLLFTYIAFNGKAEPKPDIITLYNTGFAHHIFEGTVGFEKGIAILSLPVSPLYGTWWVTAPAYIEARYSEEKFTVKQRAQNMPQLLRAFSELEVELRFSSTGNNNVDTISGTLKNFKQDDQYFRILALDGTENIFFLDNVQLLSITPANAGVPLVVTRDSLAFHLQLSAPGNVNELPVSLHFLSATRSWSPFYNIRLMSGNRAQIRLKGRIYNSDNELEEATLILAVGKPALHYGQRTEDFSPRDIIRTPAQRAYDAPMMMRENAELVKDEEPEVPDAVYKFDVGRSNIPGKGSLELDVFTEQIAFRELLQTRLSHLALQRGARTTDRDYRSPVHLVRIFENSTIHPWPEGAILIEDRDGNFVAQQRMSHTPAGSEISLKVSEISDIIVENSEQVTERESRATIINEREYGKALMKGTIRINNYTGKQHTIHVEKTIRGDITNISHNGSGEVVTPLGINPASKLTWVVEAGAGDPLEITYEYNTFYRE